MENQMTSRRNALIGVLAVAAAVAGWGRWSAGSTRRDGGAKPADDEEAAADDPAVIDEPVLGMLNLLGAAAEDLVARDLKDIGLLFPRNVVSTRDVPRCDVLFLYCDLDGSARIAGTGSSLRDAIRAAGARIAVVASEVKGGHFDKGFGTALAAGNGWPANIVLMIGRKGDAFAQFFTQLFSRMQAGVGIIAAWVELAPQGPASAQDGNPEMIMLPGANIAFGPRRG